MSVKKILHIAPTPFFSDRGCHIRIEGIVKCLDRLGYENTVCTYHHGRDVEGIKTYRIGEIKGYTKTSAGPSVWKLVANPKLLWLVLRTYQKEKPSTLHAHLHEGLLIGLIVKVLFFWRKTPLIADMQGSLVGELDTYGFFKKAPFLKLPFKWLEGSLLFFSSKVICSSEHALTKFKQEFPRSAHKISLAQDGANAGTPLNEADSLKLKNELGIPLDKTIVVYSGALLESKGLNELQQVIKLSLKEANNIEQLHFLIIGYPTKDLEGFLKDNKLNEYCKLTGRVDFAKLSEYLGIADIAIDSKNSDAGEGSGKMLNYIANGLAVTAFDTLNNKSFLGEDSPLAKTVEEMAEQIQLYAKDTAFREKIAKKNQERFNENHSWLVTEKQLKQVY